MKTLTSICLASTKMLVAALAFGSYMAHAQTYPTKPIRLVLPYTPGGPVDFAARVIETKLAQALGQPIVMDYRPGAGTIVGTAAVARAEPDGYTIMIGTISSHSMNPAYNPKIPYDPVRDFTALSSLWTIPAAVIVNNSVPARSIAEFIALAKANPEKLAYGTAGLGTSQHFLGEAFKHAAGIKMLHVPYQGQAGITQALIAGDIQMMFETAQSPQSREGRVRTLAVTSLTRSPFTPEVPAVSETLSAFGFNIWFGIFGPAKMPQPIADRLGTEIKRIISTDDVKERFATQRAVPFISDRQEFSRFVADEYRKWTKVAIENGIREPGP